MSLDPSGVVDLVKEGVALSRTIIDKVDEKSADNEAMEYENEIQSGFADDSPDKLWDAGYRLCGQAGVPPTPAGGAGTDQGRKYAISAELLHSMLLALVIGQKNSRLLARALNTVLK